MHTTRIESVIEAFVKLISYLQNAKYGAWHDQVSDRSALERDPWIVVALVARFRGAIYLKTEVA